MEQITVDGQVWTAERIKSLCDAIWPGKPKFAPTEDHPQQDFYGAIVESLRFPDEQPADQVGQTGQTSPPIAVQGGG